MKSVFSRYAGEPPELPAVLPRPVRWSRRELGWRDSSPAEPVFIAPFLFGPAPAELCHLYGMRYRLADTTFDGYPDTAHFVEYVVFVPATGSVVRLIQDVCSPAFSAPGEDDIEVVDGRDVEAQAWSDRGVPIWRGAQDAWWPRLPAGPLRFSGEVDLPKNATTEQLLAFDKRVRLFYAGPADPARPARFAVLTSNVKAQTVEEHYADEQLRGLWA